MNIFEAIRKTGEATVPIYHLYVKENIDDGMLHWYHKDSGKVGNLVSWHWVKCHSWQSYQSIRELENE